jgi:hypothetical protein
MRPDRIVTPLPAAIPLPAAGIDFESGFRPITDLSQLLCLLRHNFFTSAKYDFEPATLRSRSLTLANSMTTIGTTIEHPKDL